MQEYIDAANDAPADSSHAKHWYGGQILFCIGLILLGVYVIFDAVRLSLPYLERGDATYFDMPGLGPILVSILLISFSLRVIFKCVAAGGEPRYYFSGAFVKALGSEEARCVFIVFGALAVYIFVLFPYLHYALATMIFMVGMMALLKLFTWRSVLISAIYSGALWFVFGYCFNVNLP